MDVTKLLSRLSFIIFICFVSYTKLFAETNLWYAQFQSGVNFPLSKSNKIFVDNGSNFPSPENKDTYTVSHSSHASFMLTVGNKINTTLQYLKYYTLSGRLQYNLPTSIDGKVKQYSDPQFLNYKYNWDISNLALTLDTKLGLYNYNELSFYVNGGLGVSFNSAESFDEKPLINVTPRISPDFSDNTITQLTYHIGIGVDYTFIPKWIASFGYEFASFGDFRSGKGGTTWANESLKLRAYQTNTVSLGVTHFINLQ